MVPLLTFYGDDFTGSSAVMEVLSFAGVPTMLFMDAPTPDVLDRFPDLRAVGVAGIARSKSPDWMETNLPPIFEALKRLDGRIVHYKTCSTFDSAPHVGSIGKATELGHSVFGGDWVPLVVGAPAIQRYQVFGNLFAGVGNQVHRLDRHPVMYRHPVTPMDESDLCRHLSHQTDLPCGVVDLAAMKAGRADAALARCQSDGAVILALDVLDDETLAAAGRLVWQAQGGAKFAVGSQGVEYSLVAHWRALGIIPAHYTPPSLTPVDQIFAVSGSCSPITARQIEHAERSGFSVLDFDATAAVDPGRLATEVDRVLAEALRLLSASRDVLVTTARGPDDSAVSRMSDTIARSGADAGEVNDRLGGALGTLVSEVRRSTRLPRIAIGGGDTSGHALTALGAEALSPVAPLAPGAPLCRVVTQRDAAIDGLEVTLKGGQMGAPEFFSQAKGSGKN